LSGYLELSDGQAVSVRDGLLLGRVAACDVVIADAKASRRHARLISESGVVEIEDLESSNGTLLNGKPVDRRMLRDGDRIEIGKTVIVYRQGDLPGRASRDTSAPDELFGDDDDLLGGAPEELAAPAARPAEDDPLDDGEDLFSEASTGASPAPGAPADVVEFEDEVVEVQKAPTREAPVVEVRAGQRESGPSSGAGSSGAAAGGAGRVLQYSKKQGGGVGTAQWGVMVGSVFELLLTDLWREGWEREARALQETVERRMAVWLRMPFPYGSEFSWDSTGHEEISTWMLRFGRAREATRAGLAHDAPLSDVVDAHRLLQHHGGDVMRAGQGDT